MNPGKPLQRKTPLRARSTLKRGGPIKTKRKPPKPKDEAAHMAAVALLGCLVCGRPATVHHVTSDGFQRITRSDRLVVPLCPMHHQAGHDPKASDPVSVERLGHRGFTERHGIDLLAEAQRLWEER